MKIYISKAGQQKGPYSVEQLNELLQAETVTGDDSYRHEESEEWLPISQFPGFIPPPPRTPPPTPSPRRNEFNVMAKSKLSLVDRFLAYNFRFGKVFAALMSVVFLLGFVISIVVFLLSRTTLVVPTYEELQRESENSASNADDISQFDDRRFVEKQLGDKLAAIVKTYLAPKDYAVLLEDIIHTPKDFRRDYVSGLETALENARESANKTPSAEIANKYRRAFNFAVMKAKSDKEASSVKRWAALATAVGCAMATFLMLIIPALLRIEENTRKGVGAVR